MEYRQVESSSVKVIGWDVASKTLEVTFTSGRTYRYDQVPSDVANGFLNAKSKGVYLAENIRDKYTYTCLNPPAPKEPKDAAKPQEVQSKSVQRRKALQRGKKIQPI